MDLTCIERLSSPDGVSTSSNLKSSPLARQGNGDKFIPHSSRRDCCFSSSAHRGVRCALWPANGSAPRRYALHSRNGLQRTAAATLGLSRQYPVRDRGSGRVRNSPEPTASTLSACRFAKGLWCNI